MIKKKTNFKGHHLIIETPFGQKHLCKINSISIRKLQKH